MKSYIIKVILLFSFVFTNAQSNEYEAAMKAALKIHDDAKSVAEEIQSLEAFEKVTRDFPNEWLANYWAAYLCTQVSRLKTDRADDFPDNLDEKKLIYRAQKYYDKAYELKKNKSDKDKSDFHMLQGFIYSWFNYRIAETDEEKEKFRKMSDDEYFKAAKYNHANPILYVRIGMRLTRSGEDYASLVAGIALMEYAKEIFKKSPERSMTTYYISDMIGFWKSRAEKKLKEMQK